MQRDGNEETDVSRELVWKGQSRAPECLQKQLISFCIALLPLLIWSTVQVGPTEMPLFLCGLPWSRGNPPNSCAQTYTSPAVHYTGRILQC